MRALQPSRGPWQLRLTQPSWCFDVQERRILARPCEFEACMLL